MGFVWDKIGRWRSGWIRVAINIRQLSENICFLGIRVEIITKIALFVTLD